MSEAGLNTIRVGVSSCLLGEQVRFDGGHKRDRFVTDELGRFVELHPVCPEFESGMGVPRPAVRLEDHSDGIRMVEIHDRVDHTRRMRTFSKRKVRELASLGLCGFVLKRKSPTCGMERVKVYDPEKKGMPRYDGRGMFAEALIEAFPDLPVEEEGRLADAGLRENFIERVFAYRRLGDLFESRWTRAQVVRFHTIHKLQVLAHDPASYRELGRLVADVKTTPRAEFRDRYRQLFMAALAKRATPGRNTNVLEHMAGYVSDALDADSRAELHDVIHEYRTGLVPLVVPLTLLGHHARRLDVTYLLEQVYLQPHPKELMLRNHV